MHLDTFSNNIRMDSNNQFTLIESKAHDILQSKPSNLFFSLISTLLVNVHASVCDFVMRNIQTFSPLN